MKIKNIQINNFRLLGDFNLDVEDELTLIIGKNNTGKTSLLTLLNKFLNKDTPDFSFDDFNLQSILELNKINTEVLPEDFLYGIELRIEIEYFNTDDFSIVSPFMMNLSPTENIIVIKFVYQIDYDDALVAKADYDDLGDDSGDFI